MMLLLGHLLGLVTAVPVQPIARDSIAEAVIVELQIGRLNTRTVQAYRLDANALVPLGTFFDLAEIKVVAATRSRIEAVIQPGNVPLVVDAALHLIKLGKRTQRLRDEDTFADESDVYLHSAVLAELLRIEINVSWSELVVAVIEPSSLPIARRIVRESSQRARLGGSLELAPERTLPRDRRAVDGMVLDYTMLAPANGGLKSGAYSASLGAALLGGSLAVTTQSRGSYGAGARLDASWTGVWHGHPALGQLRIGDGYSTGPRTRTVRGIAFGNSPYVRPQLLGQVAYTGALGPGWHVEAYRGGRLIAFDSVNALGQFSIDAPIQYGENPIDFVAYGPFGEIREFNQTYRVAGNQIRYRKLEYGVSAGQCRTPLCAASGNVDLRYGITRRWTLQAGMDQFWRDTVSNLAHPYLGASGSIGNAVTVQAEAVANAVLRSEIRFEPSTNLIVSAEVNRFARGVEAPILTPAGRTSQLTLTGFVRPRESSSWYLEGSVDRIEAERGRSTSSRLGGSFQRGQLRLLPSVRIQSDGGPAAGRRGFVGLTSYLLPLQRLGPVLGRATGRTMFEMETSLRPSIASAFIGLPVARWLRTETGFGWSRGSGVSFSLLLGIELATVRAYSSIAVPTRGAASANQYVQGSVLLDRANRQVLFTAGPSVERGGVAGRVFLDVNGNDRYDRGEQLLPNVRVSAGMSTRESNAEGQYHVWDMVPFEPTVLQIDSTSLASPLWVPSFSSATLESGPNRFRIVDIPVAPGGLIEGRVEWAGDSVRSVAGLALVLKNLKTGAGRTIVTFTDGAFYAMGIRPGDYELTLDPRVAERRGIVSEPVRATVAAEVDGASVSGLIVRLSRRPVP